MPLLTELGFNWNDGTTKISALRAFRNIRQPDFTGRRRHRITLRPRKHILPRNASTMPRTFGRMARCRSPETAGIFSPASLAKRKFVAMKSLPLKTFSSVILREILHAVYSMKALLAVTNKGSAQITVDDIESNIHLAKPSDELVEMVRRNSKTAAEAAAIIFIHSTCENAVFQLIKLLVQHDPAPWIPCIAEKQVAFKDLTASTTEQIRDQLLKVYLDGIEGISFPKKVEKLLANLKPATVSGIIPDFEFKLADFEKIDELRHRLTHEPKFATPIKDAQAKLIYLVNTLRLLVKLAELKYPGTHKAVNDVHITNGCQNIAKASPLK